MQVKTFTGPNTQSVLSRIKAELGTDAIILSTKEGKGVDGPWCEMTAGLDRTAASAGTPSASVRPSSMDNGNGAGGPPAGWGEWHREWTEIREHLVALMKPGLKLEELTPRQRVALEYLEREGVDDTVQLALFRRLRQEPGASVLHPLGDMVPVRAWGEEHWPGRFHVLAGPSGVGKTSTTIRLALRYKQRNPSADVCLVNADCERGNGRLLLKHYAELSDIVYREVSDGISFASVVRESRNFDKVIIDFPSAGRSGSFAEMAERFGLDVAEGVAVHVVLSPVYGATQLSAFLRQYVTSRPGSIIWTKLDEACTFGAVVNAAYACGLPVSALSYGSGLRNTLAAARETLLWRLIFKRELPCDASSGDGGAAL